MPTQTAHSSAGLTFAFVTIGSLMLAMSAAVALGDPSEEDKAKIAAGAIVYDYRCSTCHGDDLVHTGETTFDLRRLRADERQRFENSVRNGKNQMPPWKGVLSDEEIDQLWHYI